MLLNGLNRAFNYRLDDKRFAVVFGDLPLGAFLVDVVGEGEFYYRCANRWLERHLGLGAAQLAGRRPGELALGGEIETALTNFARCAGERRRVTYEERFELADGHRHLAITLAPILDATGEVVQIVGTAVDLIERKQAENALREAERRYRRLFDNAIEGIFQSTFGGCYQRANRALARMLGFETPEQLLSEQTDPPSQLYLDPARRQESLRRLEREDQVIGFESQVRRRDGRLIWISENVHAVRDYEGRLLYCEGTVEDITERREAERRIRFLALHDPLTNLPNRVHFRDHLAVEVAQARRTGKLVAVLVLDVDHFYTINTSLGLSAGDAVLKAVAARLRECVRSGDVVARSGSDEFAVLQGQIASPDEAAALARRVIDRLSEPIAVQGQQLHIGCSIGMSLFPLDHCETDQLLKNADLALRRSRSEGRGTFQFFSHEMRDHAERRMRLVNGLRQALANQHFTLHYQPKFAVPSGTIIGLEALLRWMHPADGPIPPREFMPLAEETGLILPIGEWVLRAVCGQVRQWQERGQLALPVSVNLSAAQFRDRALLHKITTTLDETGVAPDMLELEITESALMQDTEAAIATLRQLVELGVRISIDDFGTGYSSLSYLKRLPVEKLKIDQVFIRDVSSNDGDRAIALAIINLGHSLGIRVVAEGVETAEQLAFLGAHGCDEIQGYYYSVPLEPAAVLAFAGRSASAPAA